MHAGFKLSAAGEEVILTDADSVILDRLEFGLQTGDISLGRWPDGTGDFIPMFPTPGAENSNLMTGPTSHSGATGPFVYPNPSDGRVFLELKTEEQGVLLVYDLRGKQVYSGLFSEQLDLSHLSPGVYFLHCGSSITRLVIY